MKIIRRLYLRDFFKLLLLIAIGMSAIFSLLDLTGKLDTFVQGKPALYDLSLYAFYNMPRFLLYLLPMSVLMCSLFTFSHASHRKEVTAIKAAGGRLRTLFYPFIATGVLLSIFAFMTGEVIVPNFSKRTAELKNRFEGKGKRLTFNEGGLWLRSKDGSPVKIDLYIVEKKIARGVTIFVTGKDSLKEMIVAESAYWNGATWMLEGVTRYEIDRGKTEVMKAMNYPDLDSPDLFAEDIKTTEEMGIFELYAYMQRLKNAGFKNTKLAVDINSKVSFPLINIFMMLLGISLSVRMGLGGTLFSAGLGLLISLFYWFSYTFSLSMGYAGIVPAFLAAWIIPFAFGMLAVYLFMKIPE